MNTIRTFQAVTDFELDTLKARVEKINKRAVKLGVPGYTLVEGATSLRSTTRGHGWQEGEDTGITRHYMVRDVELVGEPIRLNGWRFAAQITNVVSPTNGKSDVIVKSFGDLPVEHRKGDFFCQHCKTDRYRKALYVVQSEVTGEYCRVGSTCVKDFTGHANPNPYMSMMDSVSDDDFFPRGGHIDYGYTAQEIVGLSLKCIQAYGWVSGAQARNDFSGHTFSTASMVTGILNDNKDRDNHKALVYNLETRKASFAMTEEEAAEVTTALDWAKSIKDSPKDFEHNIGVIAELDYVTEKNIALCVAILPCYRRAVEKTLPQRREPKSEYVGAVGEKNTFNVVVDSIKFIESDYGVKTLHSMKDDQGRVLVWWNSGADSGLRVGDMAKIKGTIKYQGEFRGMKQTTLTRCKVVK